jgi:hypothetical protein
VVKSRRIRWAGNVTCLGGKRNAYRILVGHPGGRSLYEDLDIDRSIILTWILEK